MAGQPGRRVARLVARCGYLREPELPECGLIVGIYNPGNQDSHHDIENPTGGGVDAKNMKGRVEERTKFLCLQHHIIYAKAYAEQVHKGLGA